MQLTPEALYGQLGQLVAEMPELGQSAGPITPEMNRWMGRAAALVELVCDTADAAYFRVAAQSLHGVLRDDNAQAIAAIVHRALAQAEMMAPAASRGAFIAAGSTFDAFAAVGKVLSLAKTDVLIVDPYADEKVLTDFAPLAPERVRVRLLADWAAYKQSLKPAAGRWVQQYGQTRPLEVRFAAAKTLHDRLILVDSTTAWVLGQSFNKLAERAHTSIVQANQETAALKISAYENLWQTAVPL